MAEERKLLNIIDASAADTLLEAVSLVKDDTQVVIVVKNKVDEDFYLFSNTSYSDMYWLLSQARHAALSDSLHRSEGEEDSDAMDP